MNTLSTGRYLGALIVLLLMTGTSFRTKHVGGDQMGNGADPMVSGAEPMISYVADPEKQDLRFYLKDDSGHLFRNIGRLEEYLHRRHKQLIFAMNGGMFRPGGLPVGLYIEAGRELSPLDTTSGEGNFYLKPNGVLYVDADGHASICRTEKFTSQRVRYATQSGPMLVIDGALHPAFRQDSKNLNIRNGVGILPDGKLLFAMSKAPINFYGFADWFRQHGCRNALYLDGFVSRTWLPEQDCRQTDGDLGVLIGVCGHE